MGGRNKLVLIGNGFDLAHGLKTSYSDFIDWYMSQSFQKFCDNHSHKDCLINIQRASSVFITSFDVKPKTREEVLSAISSTIYQTINYDSVFFKRILDMYATNNWVDIECYYFRLLKSHFKNPNLGDKKQVVLKLNSEFDFIVKKLSEYIATINTGLIDIPKLKLKDSKCDIRKVFELPGFGSEVKFLNFNYTETLAEKNYASNGEVIHIHGRVTDLKRNPIIFGYGDETDPVYQQIEDSGENVYLEHIKSFGYFVNEKYHHLLSYIDSESFTAYIVGHSCGLSDRVLLNQIFEHPNCKAIEIFYHVRDDGSDNFKEITQEISRHFRPHNKDMIRRKLLNKNSKNIIPQNKLT